ncbi:CHY zinc finger protein [Enterococcus wangshanyuanii]|uniref:CHY-type domain-containing protein n=1 Tax=Enterococcus wangshanyuanii TaxID=2005703 RepID=A0ABQ1NKR2_9ENTE|nr:CHY zinc finger protein [Enterococcus wangshanyuanii]GGC77187.1 hypothetical protein GCM10011573_03540 [Enterococcus wangshanyuanii]
MKVISGLSVDEQGRCIHYASEYDVVANQCYECRTYYACYRCHDELETHVFKAWPVSKDPQVKVILCGVCSNEMNHYQYKKNGTCPHCNQRFNSKCINHEEIYFC